MFTPVNVIKRCILLNYKKKLPVRSTCLPQAIFDFKGIISFSIRKLFLCTISIHLVKSKLGHGVYQVASFMLETNFG